MIPGMGGSPGRGHGGPLQCSCPENLMDGEAWQAPVHGAAKCQAYGMRTKIRNFLRWFQACFAWLKGCCYYTINCEKIPGDEELSREHVCEVRCQWVNFGIHPSGKWRRHWQPTPVLLPGKYHGRRKLGGRSPLGRTESDTTEAT